MKVKIIFLSIFLLLYVACNDSNEKDNKSDSTEESVAVKDDFNYLVNFNLNFYNSNEVFEIQRKNKNTNDLKLSTDKVVIFNFFTTWCEPCVAEIPHLNNLAQKYGDNIKIIGVLLEDDKSKEELDKFIKENNINYDIAIGDNNYTLVKVLNNVDSIPHIALYDKNGKNINNYIGIIYEEMLDIDIQKVLK